MQMDRVAHRLNRFVYLALASGLMAVMLTALAEMQARGQSSFMLLYLVPVSLSAWLFGRIYGYVIAVASVITALVSQIAVQSTVIIPQRILTDGMIALVVFATATFWLSRMKSTIKTERTLARTDFTTGAMNKRCFYDLTEMEIRRFKRYRRIFTVGMIDLDNFKIVNDSFGHQSGDDVLQRVADILRSNLRDTDTVARIGGDEFALLLPETNADDARVVLSHTRENLLAIMQQDKLPVTFSIGVVTFRAAPHTVHEVLQQADNVMYCAKQDGKDCIKYKVYPA